MSDDQTSASEKKKKSGSPLMGQIVGSALDNLRGKARDWAEETVVEPLRQAGHKVALLAVLFASVVLCVIFLAIGIVQLLGGYFQTPGVPYLVMSGLLFVIALVLIWAVGGEKEKSRRHRRRSHDDDDDDD